MKKKIKTLKKRICAAGMVIAAAGISVPAVVGALPVESVYAAGDVEINATNFPDENFRKYVSENIDTDGDGKLSEGEISACTDIVCEQREINSLKGIEYFTALESLNCNSNKLSSLDVSKNMALRELCCGHNNLNSLDVSQNEVLQALDCSGNKLSSLDVSKNVALMTLSCVNSKLSSLDVSKNEMLVNLYCGGNNLSSLDVSKNVALLNLYCFENNLSSLDVSKNVALGSLDCSSQSKEVVVVGGTIALSDIDPNLKASAISNLKGATLSGDKLININSNTITYDYAIGKADTKMDVTLTTTVAIDATNFPDINFRNYVSENIDTNGDGKLSEGEISACKEINCNRRVIHSLKGIEYFTSLEYLNCSDNYFSTLDVSKNTALVELNCGSNNLSSLDVSKNTALEHLSCSGNNLISLDVSKNTALEGLRCNWNKLSSLDVSKNTALERLNCYYNNLSSLDVSRNTALVELNCRLNDLSSLDMSKNTALVELNCSGNKLSSLDVSGATALEKLECYENKLISLDVSGATALVELNCRASGLSDLDVSRNTALVKLYCDNNKLISLDVSGATALVKLNCSGNKLGSLDVSGATALESLSCSGNNLISLDVSKNTALVELNCGSNNLSSLDVSGATALKELDCVRNNLCSLDVSKNVALRSLECWSQSKKIVGVGETISLSAIDPNLQPSAISNLKGATLSGDKLTNIIGTITYDYATGYEDKKMDVILDHDSNNNVADINATNFPDEIFRDYVLERIDKDGDGKLSAREISACKSIYCENSDINSLKGIEYFISLEHLDCFGNNLSSLDVSKNTALRWLNCDGNNLSSLDVSGATALDSLECRNNKLSSLDVSRNTALAELYCDGNNLSSLVISKNAEFWGLSVESQNKEITVDGGSINLSAMDPNLQAAAISNLKGATLSGDKLTNITGDTITYDYAIRFKRFDIGAVTVPMYVTLHVKHTEITPESVSIDKKLLVLDKGKNGKLTATVKPDNAKDKTVTWSSSNTNVATVDKDGNVTAINHGTAKITAKTANGKTAECEVRVNFIDVTNPKDWYYNPVYWAAEKGITTGTDGKFFHADNCTREQAITFLWRMAGKPDPKNMTSRFSDVKDSKRYSYKAIMWGNENGIITGTDGKFYPTGTCTREQIVTMLWRLAGKPEPKNMNSRFKDVISKTRYSYKAVMWAQENGITTGTNGFFFPTGLCKRREIVTFIYRYKN